MIISCSCIPDKNSEIFKGLIDLNEYGEIIVDEFCNTSVEGVYACGDVTTIPYKQIIMAMDNFTIYPSLK